MPPRIDWRAVERQARRLVTDWRGLLGRNVDEAPQVLGTMLDGPVRFTPIIEPARRLDSMARSRSVEFWPESSM